MKGVPIAAVKRQISNKWGVGGWLRGTKGRPGKSKSRTYEQGKIKTI